MNDFPAIEPQDPLVEILPDLFLLRGSIKLATGVTIPRNMVVIRDRGALTLIGSVRMTADNEARLEALGKVTNLVRTGIHGYDDAYTVDRFGCKFWCLAGAEDAYPLPQPDATFTADQRLPFLDADLHQFDGIDVAEVGLIWHNHGGVLVTSDALQHYGDWRHFNALSRFIHPLMGFTRGMIVGPVWHRLLTNDEQAVRASFDALLDQPFRHMVGLHGTLCRDVAKDRIRGAMKREFEDGPATPDYMYRLLRRAFANAQD